MSKITDFQNYQQCNIEQHLDQLIQTEQKLESKEKQIELYERNTGKPDTKGREELTRAYIEETKKLKERNKGRKHMPITPDMF